MPYEAKGTRIYDQSPDIVIRLAAEAVNQLGGKILKSHPADGYVQANFKRKIKDKSFGNRCQVEVKVTSHTAEQCTLAVEAYPVDPIGKRLLFGVRGDPARLVVDTFLADLDERIPG